MPASWLSEHAESVAAQKLARMSADVDLHMRLAAAQFEGREYAAFERELTRYGYDVMFGWLTNGKIFDRMNQKGYRIPRPAADIFDNKDTRIELAGETVAAALAHFKRDVLQAGKWNPAAGATLTTYFVGQCLIRFANIYRSWLKHEASYALMNVDVAERPPPAPRRFADPEATALDRAQIRRGWQLVRDERLQTAILMRADGKSTRDISTHLGVSEKTVERMFANHRDRLARRGIA